MNVIQNNTLNTKQLSKNAFFHSGCKAKKHLKLVTGTSKE